MIPNSGCTFCGLTIDMNIMHFTDVIVTCWKGQKKYHPEHWQNFGILLFIKVDSVNK